MSSSGEFNSDPLARLVPHILSQILHEIRNPLSTIGMNLELMEEDLENPAVDVARMKRRVQIARQEYEEVATQLGSAAGYGKLLRQLLDDNDRSDPAQLGETLRRLAESHAADADPSCRFGVEVSVGQFGPSSSLPHVVANWLISPLVMNAREAFEKARTSDARIEIAISPLGPTGFVLTFRDNGPGWSFPLDAHKNSLRTIEPLSTRGDGRGWGLIHLNGIVTGLGGTLELRSLETGGAEVVILLPWETMNEA